MTCMTAVSTDPAKPDTKGYRSIGFARVNDRWEVSDYGW